MFALRSLSRDPRLKGLIKNSLQGYETNLESTPLANEEFGTMTRKDFKAIITIHI